MKNETVHFSGDGQIVARNIEASARRIKAAATASRASTSATIS